MKGRMLTVFVVLAMATAACAEPGVVGGDDANQESESVTNDAVSNDSGASDEGSATDPGSVSDEARTSEGAATEDPAPDADDPTKGGNIESDAGPSDDDASSEDDLTAAAEQPIPSNPPEPNPGPVAGLQPIIDLAKADLAGRLSVEAATIAVTRAEFMVWPDGGLGCPQPGMVYTQVLVDGTYIELMAGGLVYPYHSGANQGPFLCQAKG